MTTSPQDVSSKSNIPSLVVSGIAWLIFVYTWVRLAMRTISSWHSVRTEVHYDLILILLFFGATWIRLVRGKRDPVDMFLVSLALTCVGDLFPKLL